MPFIKEHHLSPISLHSTSQSLPSTSHICFRCKKRPVLGQFLGIVPVTEINVFLKSSFTVETRHIKPFYNEDPGIRNHIPRRRNSKNVWKRTRNYEPLYNEDPGITKHILHLRNSKMHGKEPEITNPYITKTPV